MLHNSHQLDGVVTQVLNTREDAMRELPVRSDPLFHS